jgi:thiol-disulfide isomerase/thioredoxin
MLRRFLLLACASALVPLCGISAPAASPPQRASDAENQLQRLIEEAGNDRAALVRNLDEYLQRFPEAPRKVEIYRALVEASWQLRDRKRTLEYAERIIALRPADRGMMLFAVDLLEQLGDEASLAKAVDYASRVLERLEKPSTDAKPVRISQEDWELEQKKLRMSVYLIRGRLQMRRRQYAAAASDLETSFGILANAAAALRLGEIAEVQKDYETAIAHYIRAFVLPESASASVNRREVRRKLGNLWRLVHGSEAGLGEALLKGYDRQAEEPAAAGLPAPAGRKSEEPNQGATEPFAFVLRRPNQSPLSLRELEGKILVLHFWATWCLPCRELEPLFEEVARRFSSQPEVAFLAVNGDEDESLVPEYLEREKVRTEVVFADGLDRLLEIRAIPTIIVLDRGGKIVYRAEGFAAGRFVEDLSAAIERALGKRP